MEILGFIVAGLIIFACGIKYGYTLKVREIEEGSLLEAILPDPIEKTVNKAFGKKVFKTDEDAVDIEKGSNND